MPQLQLAVGTWTGDLFALVVLALVWAIAVLLERAGPAARSSGDGWVATLEWESPAAPEPARAMSQDVPPLAGPTAPEDLAA